MYWGGNIGPGLLMRLRAMHKFTAALPDVAFSDSGKLLGTSTEMALQNGALMGICSEIEGFIGRITQKFGKINTILTGGDSEILGKKLKTKIFVVRNLVLKGLVEILKYNEELEE